MTQQEKEDLRFIIRSLANEAAYIEKRMRQLPSFAHDFHPYQRGAQTAWICAGKRVAVILKAMRHL